MHTQSRRAAGANVAIILVVGMLATACRLAAQSPDSTAGMVVVLVTTKGSGEPVDAAVVSVRKTQLDRVTGDAGSASFNSVPTGHHQLLVRRRWYVPARLDFDVRGGGVDTLRIELVKPDSTDTDTRFRRSERR